MAGFGVSTVAVFGATALIGDGGGLGLGCTISDSGSASRSALDASFDGALVYGLGAGQGGGLPVCLTGFWSGRETGRLCLLCLAAGAAFGGVIAWSPILLARV